MTWLALAYFLSVGTLQYQAFTPQAQFVQSPANDFETTLGVEVQMLDNHLFSGGSVQTWEGAEGNGFFEPWESLYTFNVGLRGWGFEIEYRHECDHPVIPTIREGYANSYGSNKDEIYLSYKATLKIF